MKKIRESIPEVLEKPAHYCRPFTGERLTEFKLTTEDELRKMISKYGIKTCMEDPIPSKLMSSAIDVVLPVLMNLINILYFTYLDISVMLNSINDLVMVSVIYCILNYA